MKKKEATPSGASEWNSPPAGRITPMDIQQKEFQVARFGAGYRMREVDEFLDQVTDALSALVAENERLLRGSGDPGSAPRSEPARPATGGADRAAVEAFILREKGFLQDLGGLVQEHAEELRSMVRVARQSAPATAATAPVAPEAAAEVPDEAEAPEHASEDAERIEATDQGTVAVPSQEEGLDDDTAQEDDDEPDAAPRASAMPVTEVAEEPIRLDEPEPARSGRQDEKEDGSLRELFWGEE